MNVWFASDHHFSHANILTFTKPDGSFVRPGFSCVEEMDELMIENHNKFVGPRDKVYFLGDVCFNLTRFHAIMPRLNGQKRLIMGNHDRFAIKAYGMYFHKVMESWQPVRNLVFSHRPLKMDAEDHHKITYNVHGHTHSTNIPDHKYLNLCVENHEYSPVHWDEIVAIFKYRGIKIQQPKN